VPDILGGGEYRSLGREGMTVERNVLRDEEPLQYNSFLSSFTELVERKVDERKKILMRLELNAKL
jgi:hypothetical protein